MTNTHSGGINPNAIIPDPKQAGRDKEDLFSKAPIVFKTISGQALPKAINVTAATSSGILNCSIMTSMQGTRCYTLQLDS